MLEKIALLLSSLLMFGLIIALLVACVCLFIQNPVIAVVAVILVILMVFGCVYIQEREDEESNESEEI